MPDIAMCPSRTCSVRERCYRNEASGTKPNEFWQTYLMRRGDVDREGCGDYIPVVEIKPQSPAHR